MFIDNLFLFQSLILGGGFIMTITPYVPTECPCKWSKDYKDKSVLFFWDYNVGIMAKKLQLGPKKCRECWLLRELKVDIKIRARIEDDRGKRHWLSILRNLDALVESSAE